MSITNQISNRNVGDDYLTICGDQLRPGARRLCGGCATTWSDRGGDEPTGCGDVLERHEAP